MLTINFPLKVKLVCVFIYKDIANYTKAKKILQKKYGPIDYKSPSIDFNYTNYYTKEMGTPLHREFVSFGKLQKGEDLVKIKLFCIKLEKRFAVENRRSVNIDPGYINEARLVLATTKDFSHRVYLGKGIFAEVTLNYFKGEFCHFPTTFPDYRTTAYKNILADIRAIYCKQIK
ncbi:MAG: DUF4416 family protein [Candidatus Omnitrophica bacterium]|nr:DUF4416 family protein [Candidatus Omnitrophota bacterium]